MLRGRTCLRTYIHLGKLARVVCSVRRLPVPRGARKTRGSLGRATCWFGTYSDTCCQTGAFHALLVFLSNVTSGAVTRICGSFPFVFSRFVLWFLACPPSNRRQINIGHFRGLRECTLCPRTNQYSCDRDAIEVLRRVQRGLACTRQHQLRPGNT